MLKEFKEFAMRGSVMDLAVGVVIGTAFGRIVTSLVNDMLMPVFGLLLGKIDLSNLFLNVSGTHYATLAEAQAAGAATINYGNFLNAIVEFLIIAFAIFLMVKQINRLRKPETPTTKECAFCASMISKKASRCPECTSAL